MVVPPRGGHLRRNLDRLPGALAEVVVGAVQAGEHAVEPDVPVRVGGHALEVLERDRGLARQPPPAGIRGGGRGRRREQRNGKDDQEPKAAGRDTHGPSLAPRFDVFVNLAIDGGHNVRSAATDEVMDCEAPTDREILLPATPQASPSSMTATRSGCSRSRAAAARTPRARPM